VEGEGEPQLQISDDQVGAVPSSPGTDVPEDDKENDLLDMGSKTDKALVAPMFSPNQPKYPILAGSCVIEA